MVVPPPQIIQIIGLVSQIIAYFGVAVIAYGALMAIVQLILREVKRAHLPTYTRIRGEFAHRIIFALDFLIASDILGTIAVPDLTAVAILGGTVLIRAVLTIILSRETTEMREEEREAHVSNQQLSEKDF